MLRVHSTTVFVSDQDQALEFYVGKLGFEKREDTPMGEGSRWLVVAPPDAETGIALLRPADAQREGATAGGHTGISLVTGEIQRVYDELVGRGVQFSGPPRSMPWGDLATWRPGSPTPTATPSSSTREARTPQPLA